MSKHTPKPWKWECKWEANKYDPNYNGSMGGLEPGVLWYGLDGEEGIYCRNEADSCLIAAAPELLEACKLALDYLQKSDAYSDGQAYPALLKAIAKAEGIEPAKE